MAMRGVYRALRMAGNVIDADRFSNHCVSLILGQVELIQMLENSIGVIRPYFLLRDAEIVFCSKVKAPCVLTCDSQAVDRIVYNLISNAIKHLPRAGGHVEVVLREAGEMLELTVADNGDGISEQGMEHAFEKYWHDSGIDSVDRNSYGLGLYIAQGLAKLHGGSVSLARGETGGTVAKVILPRFAPESGTLSSQPAEYNDDHRHLTAMIELSDVL